MLLQRRGIYAGSGRECVSTVLTHALTHTHTHTLTHSHTLTLSHTLTNSKQRLSPEFYGNNIRTTTQTHYYFHDLHLIEAR